MREPQDVRDDLASFFAKQYSKWAQGQGTWPRRFALGLPATTVRRSEPVACMTWAARWKAYNGPGTVEWQRSRFPTGMVDLPTRLVIADADEAARVTADATAIWQRCKLRLNTLRGEFTDARFDTKSIRELTELDPDDFERLTAAVAWLRANPTSGMLLRQLPIESISTKWLERHTGLVEAMLGGATDSQTSGAELSEHGTKLHQRLGLRVLPTQIPVHVLDPRIRAELGGMRHFQAAVEDLNRWKLRPSTVLIMENKQTAYALDGIDLPGTVVVHAKGFHTQPYTQIVWIRQAEHVIYWGDLDTWGLEFLDDLRRGGIPAESILTDEATFDQYAYLVVPTGAPQPRPVPHLTFDEQKLYDRLVLHGVESGAGILLEQERIPWSEALPKLLKAARGSA